jgi:hypothetical protein
MWELSVKNKPVIYTIILIESIFQILVTNVFSNAYDVLDFSVYPVILYF